MIPAKVYDYVDTQVPMLMKMFQKRIKGYKAIGYRIEADSGKNRVGLWGARLLRCYPTLRAEDLSNAWAYYRSHGDEIDRQIAGNELAFKINN